MGSVLVDRTTTVRVAFPGLLGAIRKETCHMELAKRRVVEGVVFQWLLDMSPLDVAGIEGAVEHPVNWGPEVVLTLHREQRAKLRDGHRWVEYQDGEDLAGIADQVTLLEERAGRLEKAVPVAVREWWRNGVPLLRALANNGNVGKGRVAA